MGLVKVPEILIFFSIGRTRCALQLFLLTGPPRLAIAILRASLL